MVNWDTLSLRKPTGGLNNSINARDKKEAEKGGVFAETKISPVDKRKVLSGLGGLQKTKLLTAQNVSITDPHTKKTKVATLITVKQNDANRQYARRNIITRGAVCEVQLGNEVRMVRITSRPGHSGTVSGILLSAQEQKAFEQPKTPKVVSKVAKKPAKKPTMAKKEAPAKVE